MIGSKESKRLSPNTVIEKSVGVVVVRLFNNPIVVMYGDTIAIDHCGKMTKTTKMRINQFLRANLPKYSLFAKKGTWYLHNRKDDTTVVFDGYASLK
jgi:hypothetical protein